MTRLCLAAYLTASLLTGSLPAEDWPQFRGPTGQGLSAAADLPLNWSRTENVRWRVEIPGEGWSSPVVSGGRIFLTTAVAPRAGRPNDRELRTLCLDAETGRRLWNVKVFDQKSSPAAKIHTKNSHASATPVINGNAVYVHFGTHGTAALTTDGKILWKTRALEYNPVHGNGGSPALVGDKLIVCCDGGDRAFIAALNADTGNIEWKKPRPPVANSKTFSFSTPLVVEVAGSPQVICPGTDLVIAYDPRTGREIWQVNFDGYSVVPRPVFGHNLVYVCTGWSPPKLLAIRPDGSGNVTQTHLEWKVASEVSNTPSPLLVENELYVISDKGVATCLDPRTGELIWKRRIGGNYSASPLYAAGKIYLQSERGITTVLRAGREFQQLAKNRLGEDTLASPAVVGSDLLLRSAKALYRIQSE